jgi:hypothetical protein
MLSTPVGPVRPPKTVGELVGFGRPGGLTFRSAVIMRLARQGCTAFLVRTAFMTLL